MKKEDVFGWKINHGFLSFVLIFVLTIIPGTILWFLSLGYFRYFNLITTYCNFTVKENLKREYPGLFNNDRK